MAVVVRIVEKTWKKDFGACELCEHTIEEGQDFLLKTTEVETDGNAKYVYEGAHLGCAEGQRAWVAFEYVQADEGLSVVREVRGHCFRVGASVVLHGLPAVIQGGVGGRVDVVQNGVKKTVDHMNLTLAT